MASLALLGWMVVVAVAGVAMVIDATGVEALGSTRPTRWEPQMVWAFAIVAAIAVVPALLARLVRPSATYPVMAGMAVAVVTGAAIGTDSVAAFGPPLAILAGSYALGDIVVRRLPSPNDDRVVHAVISLALGSGLVALLLLLVSTFGQLNATFAVGTLLVVVVAWLAIVRPGLPSLHDIDPPSPSWFEAFLAVVTTTLLTFALLYALTPELHSDAVRNHLPIAREFWQSGFSPELARFWPSSLPVHAHILYAAAWGFGGDIAVKLVHAAFGLLAFAAVFALGRMIAGRLAGVAAVALFASIPLALWELGTAYVDMFPVLFFVTAMIAVLQAQRSGSRAWLLVAGALAGFAFAAKITAGTAAAAIGATVLLVGRSKWSLRARVLDVAAFILGGLIIVPWLARSFVYTGVIPGLDVLLQAASGEPPRYGANLVDFGIGRNPIDMLTIPWDLTFNAGRYFEVGFGWMGVALLMAGPLALLAPRTRATALLLGALLAAFVAWAITAQYGRYALPWLALASVLAGVGVARVVGPLGPRLSTTLARTVPILLGGALLVTPLLWLPSPQAFLQHELFTGSSREEVQGKYVRAYEMLKLASEILPEETPLAWIGRIEPGQSYTEAAPVSVGAVNLGNDARSVLEALDQGAFDYILWDRTDTEAADWRSTVLSTPFLRDYTAILGVGGRAYLFEVFDEPGARWGLAAGNLLDDPRFQEPLDAGPWTANDAATATADGVRLRPDGNVFQRVPVSGDGAYVLTLDAVCSADEAFVNPSVRWFDRNGVRIDLAWELLRPGVEGSEQFVWSQRPERAVEVVVSLDAYQEADCTISEAALQGPAAES